MSAFYRNTGKRWLDLALVAVGLVAAIPIMAVTALVVLLGLGPPVLFVQVRAGRHGRQFRLFKFRTMRASRAEAEADADRLGAFGRALRASSLDELPQLWNVLAGDMSLVGPRPLYLEYIPRYSAEQARRLEVQPGLTGWAQVNGRNELDWPARLRYDVWYVDHVSASVDFRILVMTAWRVLSGGGISQPGHATMEPFLGDAVAVDTRNQPDRPRMTSVDDT